MAGILKKRWFQLAAVVVLVLVVFAVPRLFKGKMGNPIPEDTVAEVAGRRITAFQLQVAVNRRLVRIMATKGKISSAEKEGVLLSVFKEMLNDKILEITAKEQGVTVTAEDMNKHITELKFKLTEAVRRGKSEEELPPYTTDDLYANFWSNLGFRYENEFVEYLKYEIYEDKLSMKLFPESSYTISQDEINSYMPRVELYQIFLQYRKDIPDDQDINFANKKQYQKAREIYARILNGADFSELARLNSQETYAAADGYIGWVSERGVVPEFWEVVANLRPGEITEPFVTRYGLHIVRCVRRKNPDDPIFEPFRKIVKQTVLTRKRKSDFVGWFYRRFRELEESGQIKLYHPVLLANKYRNTGKFDEAVAEYRKAIAKDREGAPYYHIDIAWIYARQQKFADALKELRMATEKAPTDPLLYFAMGEAYMEVGEHEKAINEFKKASDMSKLDYELHQKLMQIFTQLGLLQEAQVEQERMQHAIELLGGAKGVLAPGSPFKNMEITLPGGARDGSTPSVRDRVGPEDVGLPDVEP